MEWKLINIWDVVQTKTGVVGIVITKFTDHINLALHGHIQTILITDIEFKLGNIKSLINIFPISKQYSSQDSEEEKEQQIYFDYEKDSLKDKLGKISMDILFKRGKGKNPEEAVFTCCYANASSERVIFPLSYEATLQEAFNDMKDHVLNTCE